MCFLLGLFFDRGLGQSLSTKHPVLEVVFCWFARGKNQGKTDQFFGVGRCRRMYGYHVISCQCHIPMFANTTFVWVVLSAIFISSLAPWICWDIQAAPCCHGVSATSHISLDQQKCGTQIQGSTYHLGMCLKLWLEVFADGLWISWLGFPSISVSRSQEIAGAEDQSGICVGRSL